jgi:hypothetical protein
MAKLAIKKLNTSDDFLTPPELVEAMGEFDLDPCSSHRQCHHLAKRAYRFPEDNGLLLPWEGAVFVNPPFSELQSWISRFVLHANGVLLVPARVEVSWFWKLWHHCDGIFLTKGPVKYLCPEGKSPPRFFGGAFCAIGGANVQRLHNIPLKGVLITERLIR